MNKTKITFLAVAALMSATVSAKAKKMTLTTDTDSVSYALGVSFASEMKKQIEQLPGGENMKGEILQAAVQQVFAGQDLLISADDANGILMRYIVKAEEAKMLANKQAGEKFLAENAKRQGVVALPSGLQYEVLEQGTGARPSLMDKVKVNYRGTLIDGTEFDSSYKRNQPATFGVTQVIRGWTEALQLMPVGSKWRLYIPSNMAYGERRMPGSLIEPYSTLIFDVELLEIVND